MQPDYVNPDLSAKVISGSEFSLEPRERKADFESPVAHLSSNLSTTRRPDAVSFDYLTSFTYGPVAQADTSLGSSTFAWRVRTDGRKVFVSRQNDANNAWLDDVVLFEIPQDTAVIEEIDSAFDQNARIFFAVQRQIGVEKQIWIYYFDPLVSAYTFTQIAVGRTPRCILDNPQDTSSSDILLFYVDDAANCVNLRQQRDRYGVVYATPITEVANKYLEEVSRSRDNRIHVVFSERNIASGKYTLDHIESTLYPYIMEAEIAQFFVELRDLYIKTILFVVELSYDSTNFSSTISDITIRSIFIDLSLVDTADLSATITRLVFTPYVAGVIFPFTDPEIAQLTAMPSVIFNRVVIIEPTVPPDVASLSATILSATLI